MADLTGTVLGPLLLLGSLLTVAGLLIWVERRLLGAFQNRFGPNRLGPGGILQTAADMVKIFAKEDWIPPFAHKPFFVLAPVIGLVTTLLAFAVIPFSPRLQLVDPDVGLLFLLAMSAVGVYSVVLAGWSSNGKYSLLGGLRAAAQILAYEVFMGVSLLGVVVLAGSFRLGDIVAAQEGLWFCVPQALGMAVFLVAGVAETHRLPLDMPEAESELVAGYHSEYSGMKFGMFFVGEYLSVVLVSAFTVTLFFGGWRGPWLPPAAWFLLKTSVLVFLFVLLRASLPRPRYDQFIALGWRVLLPLALLNLMATAAVVLARGG